MNTIKSTLINMNPSAKFFVGGAVLMTLFQIPAMTQSLETVANYQATAHVSAATHDGVTTPMADIIFGSEAKTREAQTTITKQKAFVSSRGAYQASLAVIEKHADTIKQVAAEKNVPADVAIGVAFLENGGSETAKSPAGALGIYQLMPGTARNLGLTVNKSVDDRKNPEKSIEAGITYLATNYQRFGDWGLATWAYHAGEGNVAKALKIYAKANDGITLPGISDFGAMRDYVVSRGITVHKLLSDPSVQKFTEKLNDDSSGYPYKVTATATLFREKNS